MSKTFLNVCSIVRARIALAGSITDGTTNDVETVLVVSLASAPLTERRRILFLRMRWGIELVGQVLYYVRHASTPSVIC